MKKTRYYIDILMPGGESIDWNGVCLSSPTPLYKDKVTGEIYCYEFDGIKDSWTHMKSDSSLWNWEVKLIRKEEVEIDEKVTKLPIDNKYNNGVNWKNVQVKGANSRLPKNKGLSPYDKLNKGKPPINPKTGRRDGKA